MQFFLQPVSEWRSETNCRYIAGRNMAYLATFWVAIIARIMLGYGGKIFLQVAEVMLHVTCSVGLPLEIIL